MILDARELPEEAVLQADVIIIGAGAAGITLALELIGSAQQVLLLESGGLDFEDASQALYAGRVTDERMHSPPIEYRRRQFGGSTAIWGGRCMPFDAIDFEQRDFVPESGWPIGLDDLMPYYPAANRLCEAGEFDYSANSALPKPLRPMIQGFHGDSFTDDTLERFSCPTNFAQRYGHKLAASANVRVVLHANVTHIGLTEAADQVELVRIQTLSGRRLQARAKQFVLATGGLEVPRLLLASRDRQPQGIGNAHDLVGRFYMCHLAGTIGVLRFKGDTSAVHHGYDISDDGVYCRRRLALLPQVQRRLRLGNFIARLHHPRIPDPAHKNPVLSLLFLARPLIPKEYAKRLYGDDRITTGQWLRHLSNVIARPFDAAAFAWHMLRDRKLAERKFPSIILRSRANLYSIDFHSEQQPNGSSRIRLDTQSDELGVPRIVVDWRYTAGDVDTCRRAIELLATDLEHSGVGRLEYDPGAVEMEMTRYGAYGGHHMGTARMGTDPCSSVVDADCRVHGVGNLFIAGAAVFPTSSQANPTLTIVALALRLAAHLKGCTKSVLAMPSAAEPVQATHLVEMGSTPTRVLVLGCGEFIGGRVLRALAESGWARPVADNPAGRSAPDTRIEYLHLDPTDPAALTGVLKSGIGVVVNCLSGQPKVILGAAEAVRIATSRCEAPPLVVHVSSMSVYGALTGDVAEDTALQEGTGAYARAKVMAEHAVGGCARRIILRPGCEYGPGGELWSGRIARWLVKHRIGDLGAAGDGYCNLVHIDDLASAVLVCLTVPEAQGQVFNLAMPDPPTWNEYFGRYALALGAVPIKRISKRNVDFETRVLAPPLKILELAAKRAGIRSATPPPIPPSLLPLMRQDIRLDCTRARSILGWRCISLEQGLREVAAWFTSGRDAVL
jgi:choline dehydrogenase-like flavoprotein/nucleoside-diphosphate-sugar epimerase